MITLKSSREIALMKEAGKVVAKVFETVGPLIKPGISTFEINEIAEKYQLSRSYVSNINNGECLHQENETYPLQQNRITTDEYLQIIDLIENTTYSLREIARYMGRNRDTIEKINKGHQ